jgi:hypothetical protein
MGVIFAGDSSTASSDNVVRANVIADSKRQYNVESSCDGTTGSGNALTHTCLWGGAEGNVDASEGGFTADGNVVADPLLSIRRAATTTCGRGALAPAWDYREASSSARPMRRPSGARM